MYVEIKTDDPAELHRVFDEAIKKGQRAMLTLGKDGDFWSLASLLIILVGSPRGFAFWEAVSLLSRCWGDRRRLCLRARR
jgi:hypothetical protein